MKFRRIDIAADEATFSGQVQHLDLQVAEM